MGTIFMVEAFVYGLSGAIHCLGMCGPLALWVPVNNNSSIFKVFSVIIYGLGRIVSYTFIGVLVGIIGIGFKLIGLQDIISIICGIILILMSFTFAKTSLNFKIPIFTKIYTLIKTSFDYTTNKISNKYLKLFCMGLINGFLPCGFLYFAVITATALGVMWQSALYMVAFGFGTIPIFIALILLKSVINIKYNRILQFILPFFTIVIGIILILRGLNLGIPMMSPKLNKMEHSSHGEGNKVDHSNMMHCH